MELTKKEIERIRPLVNNVFVCLDKEFNNEVTIAGKKIVIQEGAIDVSSAPEYDNVTQADQAGIFATVIAVPLRLSIKGQFWLPQMEIEKGDRVLLQYGIVLERLGKYEAGDSLKFTCEGKTYIMVKYTDLILRIRDGVIFPLNGLILGQPVNHNPIKTNLIIPDTVAKKHNVGKRIVVIKHIGTPVKYAKGIEIREDDFSDLKVGDMVFITKNHTRPIEPELYRQLDESYIAFHGRDIIAKTTTKDILI